MEADRKYVVGIGEALWDVLPEGKKIGGAPANFAYHVSQFGLESRVVSAVGDDALGEEILTNFREKNLQCMVPKVAFPTGTVQVTVDAAGVPCYDIMQGVAWDNIWMQCLTVTAFTGFSISISDRTFTIGRFYANLWKSAMC